MTMRRRVFTKDVIRLVNGFADDNLNRIEFIRWLDKYDSDTMIEMVISIFNCGRKYNEISALLDAFCQVGLDAGIHARVEKCFMIIDGKLMNIENEKFVDLGLTRKQVLQIGEAAFVFYGKNDNRLKFYPEMGPQKKEISFWRRIFG